MKSSRATRGLAGLGAALLLAGCADRAPQYADFVAGHVTGRVATTHRQADQLSSAIAATRRIVTHTASEFDETDRSSEINKINRIAGAFRMQLSMNTFRAIDLAHYYGQLTGGAYDITVGSLEPAWGIGATPVLEEPPPEELAALRDTVGPQHIQLSEQGAISILTPGTRLALGDLKYAYGTDLAILELRRRELGPALVQWEDYARALDASDDGLPARVPIRHPFGATNALGVIDLSPHAALAVADLYQHAFTIGATRHGGIINPLTGRPATGAALVAVRGPTCTMAHALAHALVALGPEQGAGILKAFPECDVLLVPDRQPVELWMTDGWKSRFAVNPAYAGAGHALNAPREEPAAPETESAAATAD